MKRQEPSHTKTGPGRRHIEGKPGKERAIGKGFKGVSFSIPRKLSPLHPVEMARIRAWREEAAWAMTSILAQREKVAQ